MPRFYMRLIIINNDIRGRRSGCMAGVVEQRDATKMPPIAFCLSLMKAPEAVASYLPE